MRGSHERAGQCGQAATGVCAALFDASRAMAAGVRNQTNTRRL
ncbi:hypothetical protein [Pseudomonas phage HMGUpa1]|nr:hypothetical protein [Pseudomonas phage HMGUpa1]